jgi:hypothetical protein
LGAIIYQKKCAVRLFPLFVDRVCAIYQNHEFSSKIINFSIFWLARVYSFSFVIVCERCFAGGGGWPCGSHKKLFDMALPLLMLTGNAIWHGGRAARLISLDSSNRSTVAPGQSRNQNLQVRDYIIQFTSGHNKLVALRLHQMGFDRFSVVQKSGKSSKKFWFRPAKTNRIL